MSARLHTSQRIVCWVSLLVANFVLLLILTSPFRANGTAGSSDAAAEGLPVSPGLTKALMVATPLEEARDACGDSFEDSHGFFCEAKQKWDLRKDIARRQQKNQEQPRRDSYFFQVGRMGTWFQNNYEPEFSCDMERRIGRPGDGGKWVCNPHRIPEVVREQGRKCVVFSVGSNNDFSFEESILKEVPGCEIHTFDHTITPRGVPNGVHFHSWGMGTEDVGNIKTLSTILKELNIGSDHSLEILKIDVEGAEWDTFVGDSNGPDDVPARGGLLTRDDFPFARQILIELHPKRLSSTRAFFQLMQENGYVISHKESNTVSGCGKLAEYAFMKVNMGLGGT